MAAGGTGVRQLRLSVRGGRPGVCSLGGGKRRPTGSSKMEVEDGRREVRIRV